MGCLTRSEVLDCMVGSGDGYPDASGIGRTPSVGYSGWRWARIAIGEDGLGREWHLYREDGSEGTITPRDYEDHKAHHQQGDPNAHESARTPEQPAWNGDGLPPAGEVVEVLDEDLDAFRVIVIGYSFDETQAAVEYIADRALEFVDVESLRTIRGDEEKAIDDIVGISERAIEDGLPGEVANPKHLERAAKALLAAGYRKTEGV